MSTLLTDKTAIIYGAAGTLGSAVARTFAREGATVHLAGRTREPLAALAAELGGHAHVVDARDEAAVDELVRSIGRVDVSFNLTTRGDVQGTPLLDMDVEDFLQPIHAGARAEFITARAAARAMVEQGSGVILMVTSASGSVLKPSAQFMMGGTGPADAAAESFLHYLAAEVGPRGVRVVGLWTAGVSYPDLMKNVSLLGRGPTTEQFAETATFVASERGSGITNAIVNVSSGVAAN
jgi:NAD(P)-dependent dehydrogenase (short-subunit alcohol dehydrogenase family)